METVPFGMNIPLNQSSSLVQGGTLNGLAFSPAKDLL